MSDSADEVVEVNVDQSYNLQKVQQLRDCAPFVRNLLTNIKSNMAEKQWRKLNSLAELLESDMSPAMFLARFTESNLLKMEAVINKLKFKCEPLLNPTEVIVIDGDQPSTSAAAAVRRKDRPIGKLKINKSANATATATASGTLRACVAKTNTVSGTAKKRAKATTAIPKKPTLVAEQLEVACRSKTSLTAATEVKVKTSALSSKLAALRTRNLTEPQRCDNSSAPMANSAATTSTRQAAELERRVSPTSPVTALTNREKMLTEKGSSAAKIHSAATAAAKPAETERFTNPPAPPQISGASAKPKPDFERRSNPSKPTSMPTNGLNFDHTARIPDIDSSIGSRRKDYVRRSLRSTQSPINPTPLPDATTEKSAVFERRQKLVPGTTAINVGTQRKSNPPAPESSPSSSDEVNTKAALEEARKKLAALRGTPEASTSSPPTPSKSSPTIIPLHLASNCNDPRGRNGSYLHSNSTSQVPPKPGLLEMNDTSKWPLPQSIPVIALASSNVLTATTHVSPLTQEPISVIGATTNNNNNNNNFNLNMPKAPRVSPNLNRAQSLNNLPPGSVDRGGFPNGFPSPNNNNVENDAANTRRYGNHNGAEIRDPRCAKWSQFNGAQQQQQSGLQYSPQNGSRRPIPPIGWQATNNQSNYDSYTMGNGNQYGNGNNNSPGWNNNSNNNNHFNNGSQNFGYNHRPTFNRTLSLGGIGGQGSGNHNNNNKNSLQYPRPPPVARTYREHLAAKAKQQEMKRQQDVAEKRRQQEAAEAEKKRKLQEAEKQDQLEDEATVATSSTIDRDKVQLDTSYRNVVVQGNTTKKLDFKIPKKASVEKAASTEVRGVNSNTKNNKCDEIMNLDNISKDPSKSIKFSKTEKKDLNTPIKAVRFEKSDIADKTEKEHTSGNKIDKEDKSSKSKQDRTDNADKKSSSVSESKKNKSKNKKDEDRHEAANRHLIKKDKTREDNDKKKPLVDNSDNVENEPPRLIENSEPQSADKLSEKSKHSETSKLSTNLTEIDDKHEDEAKQPADEDKATAEATAAPLRTEENIEEKKLQRCKKEEHAMVVIPKDVISTKETPLKAMPELKRILQRRKSMMPTASKPLIDKRELFAGGSLDYEDLVDHKREQQKLNGNTPVTSEQFVKGTHTSQQQRINKNLAIMFEKTSDNCSISTQNILAGKRRTRLNELTLNETQLSRNVFKVQPSRAKTDGTNDSAKRKRGRPRKEPGDSPDKQEIHPTQTPTTAAPATGPVRSEAESLLRPPPKKRSKRSELDKLNDDIAQMHYANDVLRATGRRACSAQSRRSSSSSSIISNSNTSEYAPYIRNVARRGHHYMTGMGLNRAAVKSQQARSQSQITGTRKVRVRVARCAQLERMLKEGPANKVSTATNSNHITCLVKNVNPEWHSQSSAVTSCVVCVQNFRFPMWHYISSHGEFYGARLPPNVLEKIRAGELVHPIYRTEGGNSKFSHVCVFCQRNLEIAGSSWVEHYARHTGEFNYQCSHCKGPRNRQQEGEIHVAKCAPDARLITLSAFRRSVPVVLYICRLCNFCQLSPNNLKTHLQRHHDILHPTQMDLSDQLTIFNTDDVPVVSSKAAAKRLLKCHKSGDTAKPLTNKRSSISKAKNSKARNKCSNKNKAKNFTKTEPLEPESSTPVTNEVQLQQEALGDSLGMPPSRPDEEQLLVINECKLEHAEDIPCSSLPGRERVLQSELDEETEIDGASTPKLEVSIAIAGTPLAENPDRQRESAVEKEQVPATEELLANLPQELVSEEDPLQLQEPEKDVDQQQPMEQATLEEKRDMGAEAVEQQKESQFEQDVRQQQQMELNIEKESQPQEQQRELELEPDQAEQLQTENKAKGSRNSGSKKSLFRNYNKLCNRLKSRGSRSSTSSNSNSNGSPSHVRGNLLNSPGRSSIESEDPDLDSVADVIHELPLVPSMSPTQTIEPHMLFLIRVQNVAFRLRGTSALKPAYYCRYPGCSFIFSNELEGLENHFTQDHSLVRWDGSCTGCLLPAKEVPDNLSIREELRHMVLVHMNEILAPKPAPPAVVVLPAVVVPPAVQQAPPDPEMPKLRVRRFTGDRLAQEPEQEPPVEIEPNSTHQESESTVNENNMLRVLLAAPPRPPSQQQQELNSAGVGEFLCDKTPPVQVDAPIVINHSSEIGLQINQVYSLADSAVPGITAETVPLHVASNNDFVITQSLTQNLEGPVPAEINISIEHRPENSPPTNAARREQRTQLIADRFRCMAPNCNFCAHTVMCIREHMKFHSFSFGPKDYLQCAYCSHVGKDVNEYVQHGVIEHGLANREELQEPNSATYAALSQSIRDVLRNRSTSVTATTTAQSASEASRAIAITPNTQGENDSNIGFIFEELLKDTGCRDDKLYACPFKGCNVNLTEDAFVNHVRYHKSSNPNAGPLTCKFCTLTFEMPIALRSHLQHMHRRHKYFCSICLETTVNPRLMLQHVRSRHEAEFQKLNCQQQFLELTAAFESSELSKCWVSAMEQPFGQKQMEEFLGRLIEELRLRQNNKCIFRPSELHLIAKASGGRRQLQCAQCNLVTNQPKTLYSHLLYHCEEAVRLAYPVEEVPPAATQPATHELIPTTTEAPTPSQRPPEALDTELLPIAPAKLAVPGRQLAVPPRYEFVPKTLRYKCGVPDCGQLLDTEMELRKHLTTQHRYSDGFECPHCNYKDHSLMVTKLLEHLSYHKRYVYQCGACTVIMPKRASVDRHIQQHGPHQDVDVIIHKRGAYTMRTRLSEVRWFKSVGTLRTSTDEWFCNLCHAVHDSERQMIGHTEVVHQRMHQYCCPYCDYGDKDPIAVVYHIRRRHEGKYILPMQCYLRIKCKNRAMLGFICNTCHEATNNLQKMSRHCELEHQSSFQYKCYHCNFGHAKQRNVIDHMKQEHAGLPGLAIQQFDRLPNEMVDSEFWKLARPFGPQDSVPVPETTSIAPTNPEPPIQIVETIDLSSDEEDEQTNNTTASAQKLYQIACSHCNEICASVDELKSQHWAIKHSKQPFYFCVQPQLCCPLCYGFKGNAKALLDEHLPNVHQQRMLVACDVRQMRECGFCDQVYKNWSELVPHMVSEAHLANDLKNLTDNELNELLELGGSTEFYQCNLCRVLMPSNVTMAQHGLVEHFLQQDSFCFRLIKDMITYHCPFCMFASVDEMETLRHMVDHCKRFRSCHLCPATLSSGFEEYIQHCYSSHRDQVKNFRLVHPYGELKKFLAQVLYQFQNGLIISKSSLRKTRYNCERSTLQLYDELQSRAEKPPIPRVLFSQLQSRNVTATLQLDPSAPRIVQRRKTLNPNDLQMQQLQLQQQQQLPKPPQLMLLPPLQRRHNAVGIANGQQAVNKQMPILQRITKRRSTYVEPGQLCPAYAANGVASSSVPSAFLAKYPRLSHHEQP